jgi:hypothetical protein
MTAREMFIEGIMAIAKCSREQAERVTDAYIRHKLVRVDPHIGQLQPKHGAIMDKEIIWNAIENTA